MKERNDICLSILLAMDTGMMIGEMCALKVSDIDLDKQLIHISKRTQRIKNDEEGSKTVYDIYEVEWPILRDITIPKELFFYLQEYLDCYDACNPPLGAPYIEIVLTIGLEETSYEKSTIN